MKSSSKEQKGSGYAARTLTRDRLRKPGAIGLVFPTRGRHAAAPQPTKEGKAINTIKKTLAGLFALTFAFASMANYTSPVSAEENKRVIIECIDADGNVTAVFFEEGEKCPNGTTANVTEDDGKYDQYDYPRPVNTGGNNSSCEEMVREAGGPTKLLGGLREFWQAPDHSRGAWVYNAVNAAELEYPGYGYFDMPGARFVTEDVVGNHISFHCEEPPQGYPSNEPTNTGEDDNSEFCYDPQGTVVNAMPDGICADGTTVVIDTADFAKYVMVPDQDERELVNCAVNGDGNIKCETASENQPVWVWHPGEPYAVHVWAGFAPPDGCTTTDTGDTGVLECEEPGPLFQTHVWTLVLPDAA